MRIQNNMMALNTYRQYNIANNQTAGYAEKLSSGYQINRAGDDAAGLAISEKMRAQIRGLNMASKNSLDAVSLIQTAEGALQSTHDILQRMRELAVQAASDTNEQVIDRGALDQEFQQLKKEIDETARVTRFNDQNLIDGTFQQAKFSTDITQSMLTTGTEAEVARVGVKSGYKPSETYEIKVKYIAAQQTQYANASRVTTGGANGIQTVGIDQNSAIQTASFEAVDGAKHNGKTFTINASGKGTDLFDGTNGLQVTMTDNDTTYTGKVIATDLMKAGSTITISFEGVGTLTLDLRNDPGYTTDPAVQNVFNISSMLDGREIKFLKSPEVTTDFNRETSLTGAATFTTNFDAVNSEFTKSGGDDTLLDAGKIGSYSNNAAAVITDTAGAITIGTAPTANIVGDQAVTIAVKSSADNATVGGKTWGAVAASGFYIEVTAGNMGTFTLSYTAAEAAAILGAGTDGQKATNLQDEINRALGTLNFGVTQDPPNTTTVTVTDNLAAGDKYENSTLTVAGALTFAAGSSTPATNSLQFTVTYDDPAKNVPAAPTITPTVTMQQIGTTNNSVFDVEAAQVLTVDLGDYGIFTLNISAAKGRTIADFNNAIAGAFAELDGTNGELKLGDVTEGRDTVKGSAAQIALELNGEVHTVGQNDKTVTFDSSGITLKFDALDLSTVNNDLTAADKFTTNPRLTDTIQVFVREIDGRNLTIQTGANQGDELDINIDAMNLQMLGLTDSTIATQKSAARAITEVNNAINQVSTQRAALGALQNRLNFKIANLDTSAENLQAAESRIRDTDMAKTMTAFTKSNILGQAATAMLAQANSQPQNVLQLLR